MLFYEAVDDEFAAALISLVKIDGAHERFERIAADVTVVGGGMGQSPHMAVEMQRIADAVQALALNDLGTGRCQEALVLAGIGVVEEIGHNSIHDGIAQELQPFIVGPLPALQFHWSGAMDHRQLIELDVTGIVARDTVNKNIKLLILDEKELYE